MFNFNSRLDRTVAQVARAVLLARKVEGEAKAAGAAPRAVQSLARTRRRLEPLLADARKLRR